MEGLDDQVKSQHGNM